MPEKVNTELQITYLKQLKEMLKTKGKHDAQYYLDGAQHNTHLAYIVGLKKNMINSSNQIRSDNESILI